MAAAQGQHRLARRTSRRAIISGVPAGLAAAGLGACGTMESAQPKPSGQPVTLRLAITSERMNSGMKQVTEGFNARGTNISITPEVVTGNLTTSVQTQAAGGDPPDLAFSHPRDYHTWANSGTLTSLESYLKKDRQVVPEILPAALDYWLRNGERYGMPHNLSAQSLYFNKEMMERRGLKTPDQYEKEGNWTFDAYLDLAKRLTAGQGEPKFYGAVWDTGSLDIQLAFIWPMGGDLWDKEGKQTVLDSKDAVDAIQFMADLTHRYGVSPNSEEWKEFSSLPSAGWGGAFGQGRSGMEIHNNDSLAPHIIPAPFPKGMAPVPKGKMGRINRGVAVGVNMLSGSKVKDAAWEFATFQSGKESEKIMLGLKVTLPWRKPSIDTLAQSMPLEPWQNASFYVEAIRRLRPTPYVGKFSDINALYSSSYSAVKHGQKTASQMISEIKPQINELLRS